jgi:transcriptional regulator with XRE-family HTH domain
MQPTLSGPAALNKLLNRLPPMTQTPTPNGHPVIDQLSLAQMVRTYCDIHFNSQPEAARHFGVSPQWLSKIVNGKAKPTPSMLEAIGMNETTTLALAKPLSIGETASLALEALLGKGATVLSCETKGRQPVITIAYGPVCAELGGHEMWAQKTQVDAAPP